MSSSIQRHLVVHATMATVLAFVASSWPGNNQYLFLTSVAAAFLIAIVWFVTVVGQFRDPASSRWLALAVPAIGAVAVASTLFSVSLKLRFALVADSFEAEVANIKLHPSGDVRTVEVDDRIGGYSIRSAHQSGGAVFFRISDDWRGHGPDGFAFIPAGLDSDFNPQTWWEAEFTKLSDDWYAYDTTPSGFDTPTDGATSG